MEELLVNPVSSNDINYVYDNYSKAEELFIKGYNLFLEDNFEDAWKCFDEAIKLNPNNYIYYHGRAICSDFLGNYDLAIKDYNTAIELAETNEQKSYVHYDLAFCYVVMGNEQKAIEHIAISARLGCIEAQEICREFDMSY